MKRQSLLANQILTAGSGAGQSAIAGRTSGRRVSAPPRGRMPGRVSKAAPRGTHRREAGYSCRVNSFPDGQVLMKKSVRIWRMELAALLTLAFIFIWLPVEHGSASPYSHAAQTGTFGHHAHTEQDDQQSLFNGKMDADCHAAALGCCMMAHCCPGISVWPHALPVDADNDGTTAASAVHEAGNDPEMVLPPPKLCPSDRS